MALFPILEEEARARKKRPHILLRITDQQRACRQQLPQSAVRDDLLILEKTQ